MIDDDDKAMANATRYTREIRDLCASLESLAHASDLRAQPPTPFDGLRELPSLSSLRDCATAINVRIRLLLRID